MATDPRIKESDFQKAVIDLAHTFGWLVAHFRPAMNKRGQWMTAVQADGAGFPDLVLVRGLHIKIAELKLSGKKPSKAQARWLAAFYRASQASAYVRTYLWTPIDWDTIVAELR